MKIVLKWSLFIIFFGLCFVLINPTYAKYNYIREGRQFDQLVQTIGPRLYVEFDSRFTSYSPFKKLIPKALSLRDDFLGAVEGRFEFRDPTTGDIFYCPNARKVYSLATFIGCLRGDMEIVSGYTIHGVSQNVTSYGFKYDGAWLEADDSDTVVFVEFVEQEFEEEDPDEDIPVEDEPLDDEPTEDEPTEDIVTEDEPTEDELIEDDPVEDNSDDDSLHDETTDCDGGTTEVDVDVTVDIDVAVDVNIDYDIDLSDSGSLDVDKVSTDDSEIVEDEIISDASDASEQITNLLGTGTFTGGACSLLAHTKNNSNGLELLVLAVLLLFMSIKRFQSAKLK